MTDDTRGERSREQKLHEVLAAYYEAAEHGAGLAGRCSTGIPSSPPNSRTSSLCKMKFIRWRSATADWFHGRHGGDPFGLNPMELLHADLASAHRLPTRA